MVLTWTLVATCLLLVSSVATFLTTLHLRCRWDVHASSVRWLFWVFFLCVFVWCVMRFVLFVWMSSRHHIDVVDDQADVDIHNYTYAQLDRLGIHGILYLEDAKTIWLTAVLCLGNVALCGIAVTLFPLTYELSRLARKSMDRGVKRERQQIRRYAFVIGTSLAAYSTAQLVLALVFGGYNLYSQRCLLGVYVLQFIALVFMACRLFVLKVHGRKFETIQGAFVASPVYQRLKRIMFVYAAFVFQFQLSMLIVYLHSRAPADRVIDYIGVSMMVYNTSGLALAITTSCSQACVFSACSPCLPDDFEAEYLHQRLTAPSDEDLEAPRQDPVFVYTDIQSSTSLWNQNGEMMSAATELHDAILRSSLLKHRGYEITTVGDAFQVAFRSMRDAVEYCMDVQLQLLVAKWPKEIHGLVPATRKVRVNRRVIFHGLRVRMGIHDACEADGRLVKDVHAVTGKTTYSGMSEVVAEFVGELGSGGQILVTGRVATWLQHHRHELSVDIFMEEVGEYTVPQVNKRVRICQLQPAMLAARAQYFETPGQECITSASTVSSEGDTSSATAWHPLGALIETIAEEEQELATEPAVSDHQRSPTAVDATFARLSTPKEELLSRPLRDWTDPHNQLVRERIYVV